MIISVQRKVRERFFIGCIIGILNVTINHETYHSYNYGNINGYLRIDFSYK